MPSLRDIRAKLDRADNHISTVHDLVKAFHEQGEPRFEGDLYSPEGRAYRERQHDRPIDPMISVVTGEALYQMRSTLDHLVCMLVVRDGGVVNRHRQFPIHERPLDGTEHKRFDREIEGITRGDVRAYIEQVQPNCRERLQDRDDPLLLLRTLNNTDKHRALLERAVRTVARGELTLRPLAPGETGAPRLTIDRGEQGRFELVEKQSPLSIDVVFPKFDGIQNWEVREGLLYIRDALAPIVNHLAGFLA